MHNKKNQTVCRVRTSHHTAFIIIIHSKHHWNNLLLSVIVGQFVLVCFNKYYHQPHNMWLIYDYCFLLLSLSKKNNFKMSFIVLPHKSSNRLANNAMLRVNTVQIANWIDFYSSVMALWLLELFQICSIVMLERAVDYVFASMSPTRNDSFSLVGFGCRFAGGETKWRILFGLAFMTSE